MVSFSFRLHRVRTTSASNINNVGFLSPVRLLMDLDCTSILPYVVHLRDVFPHGTGFVLVFEYMVTDLSEVIRNSQPPLTEAQSKCYMLMILRGVEVMHANGIMHRDLKPANLLISSTGILKIADFGLARVFENNNERLYSHQVATRWYRAPELLYGAKKYTNSVDLWAVGCIFGELLNSSPLFPAENDIEQLWFVVRVLGTPNEEMWPEIKELPDYNKISFNVCETIPFEEVLPDASIEAIDLVGKFLVYPPHHRLTATEALKHPYFTTEPLPAQHSELPVVSPNRIDHQLLNEGVTLLQDRFKNSQNNSTRIRCTSPNQVAVRLL
ncbi:unnamed protein product [Heterobilharzia americana]|nr:unnamed protein product [Heterobilharzia americana]